MLFFIVVYKELYGRLHIKKRTPLVIEDNEVNRQLLVDIHEHIGHINDNLGHNAGDELIAHVAKVIFGGKKI